MERFSRVATAIGSIAGGVLAMGSALVAGVVLILVGLSGLLLEARAWQQRVSIAADGLGIAARDVVLQRLAAEARNREYEGDSDYGPSPFSPVPNNTSGSGTIPGGSVEANHQAFDELYRKKLIIDRGRVGVLGTPIYEWTALGRKVAEHIEAIAR